MAIMKTLTLVASTLVLAASLSSCTVVETTYATPAYSGTYVSSVNYYGTNSYWGPDYTSNWYGAGVYYGPSIYSYDW